MCQQYQAADCILRMDGFKATSVIRDAVSKVLNHSVPIIAMTANAMQGDREKYLESGMDDYLSKPVKKDALAEMIDRWVRGEGRESAVTIEALYEQ
ncbi:MAG TPA: response regulator [Desulfuromonadales bacterium]|nr:response regulator [Desulfuromonadales bacterium]